ncbi:MAG: carbon starvation protein A, partial [Paramuribaculum sp.]|nr:carbon starvation protein A [Paramuribaculum sp.]
MTSFLIALAVLIGGYFIYGSVVERILKVDPSREVPATRLRDNVDYMPMPTWKVFLIQFLNIAGLGPIFGAIMGVTFGPAAFLWIVLGTIFAGAVHDFVSGYVSLRSDGASLPEIVGQQLGLPVRQVMRIFSVVLLLLVTAVFAYTPAQLIASLTPAALNADFWLIVIFAYYILATILPIDKVIGKFYPVFGFALLFMAVGIMAVMM